MSDDDVKRALDREQNAQAGRVPVTDEQLGAAIRRIAQNLDPGFSADSFDYYARSMVDFAHTTEGLGPIERCRAAVSPPGVIDGLVEHLIEMVTGMPCSADPDE